MWFVVLTGAQRTAVRGKYSDTGALEPIRAADGSWLLPARCIADVAAERPALADTLEALPRREITNPADFANGADVDAAELVRVGQKEAALFANLAAGEVTMTEAKAEVA